MTKVFRLSSFTGVLLFLINCLIPGFSHAMEDGDRTPATRIVKKFTDEPTSFGFQLSTLLSVKTAHLIIQAEYQPRFIQDHKLGVLGFGLQGSIGDYIIGETNLGFGLGLQGCYQFRYSSTQTFVPIIGYQFEIRTYDTDTGTAVSHAVQNGQFRSPFVGVWVFLNEIEPSEARNLYEQTGFSRSYITAELRNNFSSNSNLWIVNYDFYIGLRLER